MSQINSTEKVQTGSRFLIADDNMVNRTLLNHLLKPYGECICAVDGLEAVDQFKRSTTERPFDLIFMDVMMPEFDGFAALGAIRDFESEKNTAPSKVVMVSALKGQDQVERSKEFGALQYLHKPLRESDIFDLLSELGISKRD